MEPIAELPQLFAHYLKGDARERNELMMGHPTIFSEDVVGALRDASEQLTTTMREARAACMTIDHIAGQLDDIPGTSGMVRVQDAERMQLLQEEAIIQSFADTLAQLLQQTVAEERTAVTSSSADHGQLLLATSGASGSGSGGGEGAPWHQTPSLVLEVLSYLPGETVFMVGEEVCAAWRHWLFDQQTSRHFWIGCVQREFPQQLLEVISDSQQDPLMADWRTIAMLCIAQEEEEGRDDTPGS